MLTDVSSHSLFPSITEAVDLLKEMKEREVVLTEKNNTQLSYMLFSLANNGATSTIERLQDSIFTLGLAKPTTLLLSPLITAHVKR